MRLVQFDNIRGVPMHYARYPVGIYGTRGKGPRMVRLEEGFHKELEVCLEDLWDHCPWGRAALLVEGGCYVEKAGRHGEGRAIDIDALWWTMGTPVVTRDAPADPVRYLGVEAVLRMHFGTVLDYWYNGAHEDHWHIDNGMPVGWRAKSRAQALFAQAALKYVHGIDIDIDGVVGPRTLDGMIEVGIDLVVVPTAWRRFLEDTADAAFASSDVWAR